MPRKKVNKNKPVPPVRGDRLIFVRGTYAGERGWFNTSKPSTQLSVHVILDDGQQQKDDAEYAVYVRKTSVAPETSPKNAAEYVLQEDHKVAHHLSKFCEAIAEAGFVEATDELVALVGCHINFACELQQMKGRKAKYSDVAWQVKELLKNTKKRAADDTSAMNL